MSLIALAMLLAAGTQDTEPPKIDHTPVERAPRGANISVEATIKDPSGIFSPLVFARPAGSKGFASYPMDDRGDDKYVAELPGGILSKGFFDYFIEASDNAGNTTHLGSQQKPFRVTGFDPPPKPARLTVRSEPEGAELFIDGAPEGKAPKTVSLNPGAHTVAVTLKGRRASEHQFEVQPGRDLDLLIALAEGTGPGSLTIVSEPAGAKVLIDGQRVPGLTPYKGPLPVGQHRVTLELEGRLRPERDVELKEGRDVELSFALPELPKEPALSVDTDPSGAALTIDGKDRGRSPWLGPLAAGPHQVVARMEGRREVATEFNMPKGRDLSLRLDLPAAQPNQPPHLTVSTQPDGARLLVDGKEVGLTPWGGDIDPGEHKLKVDQKGFQPQDKKLSVAKNRDAEVSFALVREPGPARLRVESEPVGAQIAIDGKPVGPAPYTGELNPGEHQVEAHQDGFRGVAQQLAVEPGQSLSLRLALAQASKVPEPPQISVLTQPQGAKVSLDGAPLGDSPLKHKATAGAHVLRMELDGYQPRDAKFNFPEGRDVELVLAVSLKALREGSTVEGPDPRALARAQVKRAQACYAQGDFACALDGFKAAYEYKAVPDLLFNIAQARRKKGDLKEAGEAYRSFLRDAPDSLLAGEAQKWAAQCDAILQGNTALAKQEEDKEPPVLVHTVVGAAQRGSPLKLVAQIKDNRSGVFNPQACWRNLYQAEYECAGMQPAGKDQYAAEVPARAVVDGFAYYLEAYDNAGNGPSRTGAPEVPNAVAMLEKPAPAQVERAAPLAFENEQQRPQAQELPQPAPRQATDNFLPAAPRSRSKVPYVVASLGVVAGGIGGYFGWQARSIQDKDSPFTANGVTTHTITQPDAVKANDYSQRANLLWIGAGALLITAGILSLALN